MRGLYPRLHSRLGVCDVEGRGDEDQIWDGGTMSDQYQHLSREEVMNAHRIPASDSPDSLPVAQAYNPFSPAQTADRSPHRARDVESRPA